MSMPDYPDFTAGRALVMSAQPVANRVNATLTPGAVSGPVDYTIAQLGYELAFHITAAAGATGPDYVTLLMQWNDATTGITVWQKAYTAAAGPNNDSHRIVASGPARANQLVVTITALASNPDTVTTQYTILQTSRTYTRDRARTRSSADANFLGLTGGSYNIESGNLLNTSPGSIGASGSATRVIAFWDAQVFIKARTLAGSATMDVSVEDITGLQAQDASVFHGSCDANGYLSASCYLPSTQCVLVLTNNAGTSEMLAASVTSAETDV